jgi:hypothetical protein
MQIVLKPNFSFYNSNFDYRQKIETSLIYQFDINPSTTVDLFSILCDSMMICYKCIVL